jgi:hypothetical protein
VGPCSFASLGWKRELPWELPYATRHRIQFATSVKQNGMLVFLTGVHPDQSTADRGIKLANLLKSKFALQLSYSDAKTHPTAVSS